MLPCVHNHEFAYIKVGEPKQVTQEKPGSTMAEFKRNSDSRESLSVWEGANLLLPFQNSLFLQFFSYITLWKKIKVCALIRGIEGIQHSMSMCSHL